MRSISTVPLLRGTLVGGLVALSAQTATAQKAVPVRELSQPDVKTTDHFGQIFGVRQLKNGGVLVNDGFRRQLVTLDPMFAKRTVVVDSAAEGGQSYGPRAAPLIPYLGDSTLFVDGQSSSLLVLDPMGKIAHVMSAPVAQDIGSLAGGSSGVDAQGNLLYRAPFRITRNGPPPGAAPGGPPGGGMGGAITPPDSATIVRANFDTRAVDSIGKIKIQSGTRTNMVMTDGKPTVTITINPLNTVDEWAVLSDGTIAFVRGQDYHVDFIHPDGKKSSTAKLPFDWKRLTDEDKQALIDSARTAQEKQAAAAKAAAANPSLAPRSSDGGAGGGGEMRMTVVMAGGPVGGGGGSMNGGGGGGAPMTFSSNGPPGGPGTITTKTEFVPLKEIADYYPAIRAGAAKADLDGNLWILPTTSAQSKAGELVYDVLNTKGELFQRVRLPVGRSIAGFGHDGVVYLMHRDPATGWYLERTKIVNTARATE